MANGYFSEFPERAQASQIADAAMADAKKKAGANPGDKGQQMAFLEELMAMAAVAV